MLKKLVVYKYIPVGEDFGFQTTGQYGIGSLIRKVGDYVMIAEHTKVSRRQSGLKIGDGLKSDGISRG